MATALAPETITHEIQNLSHWRFEDDSLKANLKFGNFREAIAFIVQLSFEAEERNHHPELFNVYNRVDLVLRTHDAGNRVTQLDLDLARKVQSMVPENSV